jgi:hypothetical protein
MFVPAEAASQKRTARLAGGLVVAQISLSLLLLARASLIIGSVMRVNPMVALH